MPNSFFSIQPRRHTVAAWPWDSVPLIRAVGLRGSERPRDPLTTLRDCFKRERSFELGVRRRGPAGTSHGVRSPVFDHGLSLQKCMWPGSCGFRVEGMINEARNVYMYGI